MSVKSRFNKLKVEGDLALYEVFVFGVLSPIVAIAVALVVAMMIKGMGLNVITASSNHSDTVDPFAVLVVSGFLCGLSERFGEKILDKVQ